MREKIPEETVDLCYIDPPFNSKRNYFQIYNNIGSEDRAQAEAFTDTWTYEERAVAAFDEIRDNARGRFTPQLVSLMVGLHSVSNWREPAGIPLEHIASGDGDTRSSKPKGSFYFHCDPTASHYLKLVLDAVFVSQGGEFQNEIIWRRTGSHNPRRLVQSTM